MQLRRTRKVDQKTGEKTFFRRLRLMQSNLGGRILLLITLLFLVVFILVSGIMYVVQYRLASRSLSIERRSLCAEASEVVGNACAYLRGIVDYFSTESKIEALLLQNNTDAEKHAQEILSMYRLQGYVLSIILYNTDGEPVQFMTIDDSRDPLPQTNNPAFRSLMRHRQTYVWQYSADHSQVLFYQDNSPKVTVWRVIRNGNNSTILGAIAVSIDSRRLLNYEVAYTSSYRRNFIVLDGDSGAVISNYTGLTLPDQACAAIIQAASLNDDGSIRQPLEGHNRDILYRRISGTPLITVYIPQNSAWYGFGFSAVIAVISFVFLFAAALPVFFYINKYLTKPLERLTHEMELFSHGDYSASFPTASGDTIGNLGNAFNHMVQENRKLVDETYGAQLRAREAELSLLQSQINPHFIYNLINSIEWTALRHGEKEIANTAYSLGQVLRISLNQGNPLISVDRECELIRYYLELQKARYGDRLDYELDCSEDAGSCMIPKLILQPIVENCVVHGSEESIEALTIHITIRLEDDALAIDIEDDGVGIPPETLALLPDRYVSPSEKYGSSGFAIRNIYDRLMLTYGEGRFTFEIHSEQYLGTVVNLILPMRPPTKEGSNDNSADRG